MREIILDTETTGFKPEEGHRLIEIGCVEVKNYLPTGVTRQWYVNPERDVPADAVRVHGLTAAFLAKYPVFGDVVGEFLEFINKDPLIAHNATFDVNFLNAEMKRLGLPDVRLGRTIVDTVQLARQRFPGQPASLDALCKRFNIDNSGRNFHGALLDASLLAEVYLELRGGRQTGFELGRTNTTTTPVRIVRSPRPARPHSPTADELIAHQAMITKLKNSLWLSEG